MELPVVLCADEWKFHVHRISVAVPEICWRSSVIKGIPRIVALWHRPDGHCSLEDVDKDALSLCT